MTRKPIALSWSGGKDSTLALQTLRESGDYDVRVLLTTVTQDYDRISVHGVRRVLLEQQARSLGVPFEIAFIPPSCSSKKPNAASGGALPARVRPRRV